MHFPALNSTKRVACAFAIARGNTAFVIDFIEADFFFAGAAFFPKS